MRPKAFSKARPKVSANGALILALVLVLTPWAAECRGQNRHQSVDASLPSWTKKTGARTAPLRKRTCSVNSFGAKADGAAKSTAAVQKAIDECSKAGGGVVSFDKGEYVTGALFLRNDVDLHVSEGVTLLG